MVEKQDLTDCVSFEDRLNDLVDSRIALADNPSLGRHAQQCAACARLLRDYRQLIDVGPVAAGIERDFDVAVVNGYRSASSRLGSGSLYGQVRRSKLKWAISLTPSLVALLIVAVSMFKGSGTYERFPLQDLVWEGPGLKNSVAQARERGVGSRDAERSLASGRYPYDPIVDSVFIKSGVVDGVQDYSNAIYQLANAQSQLRACNWQQDVVSTVTSPYAPIHSQVPYRGEFSAIPKFRFLLGFTLRLIEMAYSAQFELDLSKPDLGFQTEDWHKAAMA